MANAPSNTQKDRAMTFNVRATAGTGICEDSRQVSLVERMPSCYWRARLRREIDVTKTLSVAAVALLFTAYIHCSEANTAPETGAVQATAPGAPAPHLNARLSSFAIKRWQGGTLLGLG